MPSLLVLQMGQLRYREARQKIGLRSHSKPMAEQGLESTPSSVISYCLSHFPLTPGSLLSIPGLRPQSSHPTVSARRPTWRVLLRREGAMELNDVEFPLKDAVAKGDLRAEKQRRQ